MNNSVGKPGEILDKRDTRANRFLLSWRSTIIDCCSLNFTSDGSFYFSSSFHTDLNIEFGVSRKQGNKLVHQEITSNEGNEAGIHFSLHPGGKVMHVKDNKSNKVLYRRKIDWFPVSKPFNLLRLFTPPMTECKPTKKTSGFIMDVPDKFESSLQLIVDIFPRNTKEHHPYKDSLWDNWGYCPHYLVRTSLLITNQKVPALIYWPDDNKLKL